jgi:hypothetical protein
MKKTYYCCIVLVLLIGILYLSIRHTEGYKDEVPEYCGTYGTNMSNLLLKFDQLSNKNAKSTRIYSPSECNKMNGGVMTDSGVCLKLKNNDNKKYGHYDTRSENIDINYSEKCMGLNSLPSNPPSECSIDGTLLGKNNKAFIFPVFGKEIAAEDNSVRFYTKAECDKLKGTLNNAVDDFKKQNISSAIIDKFITTNGSDVGWCSYDKINYSLLCTSSEKPSVGNQLTAIGKDYVKGLLA